MVFPDEEDGIWTLDERTGEWYLHHFYSHQPDLNLANPAVMDEILRTVGFWLELGIDGFRVDAVPFLLQNAENTGTQTMAVDPHDVIRQLRAFMQRRKGHAMLLGEVNVPHAECMWDRGSLPSKVAVSNGITTTVGGSQDAMPDIATAAGASTEVTS